LKTYFLFLIFITLNNYSFGALKSDGKTKLLLNLKDSKVQITVDEGFHINTQAPTFLETNKVKLKPTTITEKQIQFSWNGKIQNGAKVNYYVCDDAKTVCEPHVDLLMASPEKDESTSTPQKNRVKSKVLRDPEGFIINNLNVAMEEAKLKKQNLFIDFTASWCPPCLRLTHETFNTPQFKKISTQYTLVKIDVDREENQALLEQYSIHAFPSLIITNNQGVEIDRILDFIPADQLVEKLSQFLNANSPLISELNQKALAGDKNAALKMAKNAYLSQQTKECIDWYNRIEQKPIEYYMCLISQSEDATPEEQIQSYKKSIEAFSDSFYSIEWRLEVLKLISKDKTKETDFKKLIVDTDKIIQKWINTPELIQSAYARNELLELKDLVIPELYYSWGTLNEIKDSKDDAKQKFELAIQKTLELKPNPANPTIIIYLVRYLKKTHPIEEALSWLQKLEKSYPNEYTYIQRQATALTEIKDYAKALPLAEKAYSMSYGRNRLSTGIQLANIKKELHHKEEAKKLLKELQLSNIVQMKNNSRYLEKIQTAIKELE